MTGIPSVSFSPPGLAMSFKKYDFLGDTPESPEKVRDGQSDLKNYISQQDIHHASFAVISEYDW